MLSYEEAIDKLLSAAKPVEEIRHVPLNAAAGRDAGVGGSHCMPYAHGGAGNEEHRDD